MATVSIRSTPSTPDRHAIIITVIALLAVVTSSSTMVIPPIGIIFGFALMVVVVGLPHGGLDNRVGRAVCEPRFGSWWPLPFLTGYLFVGGIVIGGWIAVPFLTMILFFALSAFHFSDSESGSKWRAIVFGGMSIWLPLLARPNESTLLLSWITPSNIDASAALLEARPALFAIAGIALVIWVFEVSKGLMHRDAVALLDLFRIAVFAGMFMAAPVLVGFAISFCGWHSLRELGRLAKSTDPLHPKNGLRRVLVAAAPLSILSALMAAFGAWFVFDDRPIGPVVVQTVFLGLSAVAVPHILLHALASRLGLNPFTVDTREVANAI